MYAELLEKHRKEIHKFELYVKNFPPQVPNISYQIKQKDAVAFFNRFADVKSARVFSSKYSGEIFATVRFYDFQSMFKVYIKFSQSKSQEEPIQVEVSRTTLLICMKCNKAGHWKNECKQKSKSLSLQKFDSSKNNERVDVQKSIQQVIPHPKPKFDLWFAKDLDQSRGRLWNEKKEQEDSSLQYFCSELEEIPKAGILENTPNEKQFNLIPTCLKNQEQDNLTNYDESSFFIQPTQKQILFISIHPLKHPLGFIKPQENSKLERLYDEGWFNQISNQIGPFVKINKPSPNPFFNFSNF